jgi:uncharacterized protein (DUF1684 family)
MKTIVLTLSLFLLTTISWSQEDSITKLRTEKEAYLRENVLDAKENLSMERLDFFPFSDVWLIQAKLVRNRGKKIKIPTSTDRMANYRRYGYLCFEIDEQPYRLTVYINLDVPRKKRTTFFVPFKDLTAPQETYGGGRYLDLPVTKKDSVLINFNDVYNPYCVYSHRYSCPIPPEENHLEVRIEAGEKVPVPQRTD